MGKNGAETEMFSGINRLFRVVMVIAMALLLLLCLCCFLLYGQIADMDLPSPLLKGAGILLPVLAALLLVADVAWFVYLFQTGLFRKSRLSAAAGTAGQEAFPAGGGSAGSLSGAEAEDPFAQGAADSAGIPKGIPSPEWMEEGEEISDIIYESEADIPESVPEQPPVKVEVMDSGRKEQYHYVDRASKYIQEHYADSLLSLDVVSDYLGISSPYLSSLMTRFLTMGFAEYLNRYRMDKARDLLKNSELSITDIGEKTGFSSIQNFGRVFKKYNGESAGSYRKRMRENREEYP